MYSEIIYVVCLIHTETFLSLGTHKALWLMCTRKCTKTFPFFFISFELFVCHSVLLFLTFTKESLHCYIFINRMYFPRRLRITLFEQCIRKSFIFTLPQYINKIMYSMVRFVCVCVQYIYIYNLYIIYILLYIFYILYFLVLYIFQINFCLFLFFTHL